LALGDRSFSRHGSRFGSPARIRSDRRLCEEVHLSLAYRRFCRLGLDGDVPDHFTKNRHGRFRESDLLRHLFETVVRRCIEGFAVDGRHAGSARMADRPSSPTPTTI
jgi:hypothetical protein